MALNNSTTVPKIVAANLLAKLRQSQVFAARTNNTYRSLLNDNGNEVIINTPADATVSDYTANGTITYNNADVGTAVSLTLTKSKVWAVKLDDLDASASRPQVLQSAVSEAGVKLAETVDADVRSAMDSGATAGPAITLDHNSATLGVGDFNFAAMHRTMDINNVPRSGRWLIIDPYTAEVMQHVALANDTLLAGQATNSLSNGGIGRFGGFTIYVAPYTTYAKNTKKATATLFYGVDEATAFIDTIRKQERIRLQTTMADAVRGLYRYGVKVLDSNQIFKSAATISNVPA